MEERWGGVQMAAGRRAIRWEEGLYISPVDPGVCRYNERKDGRKGSVLAKRNGVEGTVLKDICSRLSVH